jgi:hypothetical protein
MPEQKRIPSRSRLWLIIQILVCLALLAPLTAYAWTGSFMRYSGDDYCYGDAMVLNGFLNNQIYSYLHPMAYNGNRYSLTLFSNIGDLFGPVSGAVMPGLAILFWVAGIWLLLNELGRLVHVKLDHLVKLMLAELLVFLCIYQAPYLIQDIYWRTAMLCYLAPVICLTWLIYLLISSINSDRNIGVFLVGICLLAFLAAGFSEPGATLQTASVMLGLAGFIFIRQKNSQKRRRAIIAFGAAFIISLLALLLLSVSPSNAERINDYIHPEPLQFVVLSFTFGLTFFAESLRSYPLPTLVTIVSCAAIALVSANEIPRRKIEIKKWLVVTGLIAATCIALVSVTAAPNVLARTAYPDQRAWMPGRYAMTIGLITFGLLIGAFLHHFKTYSISLRWFFIIIVFLATGAYVLRVVPRIVSDAQPFRRWAVVWDARDQRIRAAVAAGEKKLVVERLPGIIPWVSELQENSGDWYNTCAAGWYGLESISAVDSP